MYRRVVFAAVAAVLATGGSGLSEDKVPASQPQSSWPPIVIQVKDRAELIEKFCAADSNLETVVLPASLFVDAKRMLCDSGPYKRLGCDGKAGRVQKIVASNCRH